MPPLSVPLGLSLFLSSFRAHHSLFPHRGRTNGVNGRCNRFNSPLTIVKTTALQGAIVPNTWRYEFVICSRKGKKRNGRSGFRSGLKTATANHSFSEIPSARAPRSLDSPYPLPSVYLIDIRQPSLVSSLYAQLSLCLLRIKITRNRCTAQRCLTPLSWHSLGVPDKQQGVCRSGSKHSVFPAIIRWSR